MSNTKKKKIELLYHICKALSPLYGGIEDEKALSVRSVVSSGFGERGRLHFGDVTACLAPDAEQILGDWVMK